MSLVISRRQSIADYVYVANDIADNDVDEKRKRDESESLNARLNKRTDESESLLIEKRLTKRRQQNLRLMRLEDKKEKSRDNDTSSVNSRKIEIKYFTNSQT
jgi:septal ring factor EnvC (AmiA/AmiB activator)